MNPGDRSISLRRSLLVALLPGLLVALLIALSFTSSLRTLTDDRASWTAHPYQVLSQQISRVILGRLEPSLDLDHASEEERIEAIRSSFLNEAEEFKELPQVEALGPARLARVRTLFEQGVRQNDLHALLHAQQEADTLSLQGRERLQQLREDVYEQTRWLQIWLAATGALAAVALASLVTHLIHLWGRERQLRSQQARMSRELSLMASHELRRPLQQLALVADLLQHDELIGEAERARLLQRLCDSAAQLAVLSDLSRLEAVYAQPELNRSAQDLSVLLLEVAGALSRVSIHAGEELVWSVDPVRFKQAVENVLENALKYSSDDVRIELRRGERGPEVHVVDRGPGIPPQDRERIFEPFYRVPGAVVAGHGLGLAIARRFLQAHGGDILLQDEPGGTRMVLALSVTAEERASMTSSWSRRLPRTDKLASRG
ncbi:sensor histidine kinase [Deinococcus peraridilitoris]|uniref:histidine kinase n=1 Tax=Deinococcus peraridilitoris (strain DSM 19664 / LMG 22246 / CIP 109416 / KR-200) TaxID=937777 RepID=L0A197_DEIPD|nr:HAMP domain-containing sensor histidine kinase [Deinococcus peraridilitoris]AFZ66962.1 histidine kinase [Deinococcus peraridilitoris DSM 19664]